ncbi:MAG: V-type ATP synthase subunit I [Candidatus Bipolaricaulia bacterium]
MALAKMTKIRIVGHDSLRAQVVNTLQDLGAVQIAEIIAAADGFLNKKESEVGEVEERLGGIQYTLDLIDRFTEEDRGGLEGFLNLKAPITEAEMDRIVQEYDHRPTYQQVRTLDSALSLIRSQLTKLEGQRQGLLPWIDLEIPVDELRSSARVSLILGSVATDRLEAFVTQAAQALGELVTIEPVGEPNRQTYLYVIVPAELEEEWLSIASEYTFERVSFEVPEGASGLPREVVEGLEDEIASLEAQQAEIIEEIQALGADRRNLEVLYQHYHNELLRKSVEKELAGSQNTFILEGWIRANSLQELTRAIDRIGEAVHLSPIGPDPEETPPVALENRRPFRPTEFVIHLFGLPRSNELDPTPFVTPFFILFFGLAVSDLGVGLGLLLGILWMKRHFKSEVAQRFTNLGIAAAIVAMLIGLLTGSWWGPQLPDYLVEQFSGLASCSSLPIGANEQTGNCLRPFEPVASRGIMMFIGLALGLGFIQLLLGNALEWYDQARHGRFFDGLWAQGSWLMLLLGLGISSGIGLPPMLGDFSGLPESLRPLGLALAIAGVLMVALLAGTPLGDSPRAQLPWVLLTGGLWLLLMFGFGPLDGGGGQWAALAIALIGAAWVSQRDGLKGLLRRIGGGLFRLYGITGYLGDIISYVRITALGISTGLIGMAFNIIGFTVIPQLVDRFLPFLPSAGATLVSALIALVILLAGHTLNLALSSIGAFVHSARLQYVEFFMKFYEAGGERFRPFGTESTFFEIKST